MVLARAPRCALIALALLAAGCSSAPQQALGPAPGPDGGADGGGGGGVRADPGAGAGPSAGAGSGAGPARSSWLVGPHDANGSRAADAGAVLARADVATLGVKWSFPTRGAATGTPTARDGVVFAATWKGVVHAIDLDDGREVWRHEHGAQVDAPVTLWEDLALFGDAKGALTALYAANGSVAWSVVLDATRSAHVYATPLVLDGVAFVGVASDQESKRIHGDAPLDFRGSMVALDARSGAVKWRTMLAPENATGAPVWGTPVVWRDLLVFGTGNAYAEPATDLTDSVVALWRANGTVAWHVQATKDDVFTQSKPTSPDWDFGSTPSVWGSLVGIGQKSNVFWALDVATGKVAWKSGMTQGGGGIIGGSAAADGRFFVPYTTLRKLDAYDAATGTTAWSHATGAAIYSAPAVSGDIIFVADTNGTVEALDVATGARLWNGSAGGAVFGGLSVVDGALLVPVVKDGFLGERGSIVAFAPGGANGTGGGAAAGEGGGAGSVVRLRNFAFDPERIEVAPGASVTWTNDDPLQHTVTSAWDAGATLDAALDEGASVTLAFDEPGEYAFYCRPHTSMRMTVVVRDG